MNIYPHIFLFFEYGCKSTYFFLIKRFKTRKNPLLQCKIHKKWDKQTKKVQLF